MKIYILPLLLVFVVLISGCTQGTSSQTPPTQTLPQENGGQTSNAPQGEVKVFEMTAKQWEFNPSTITVAEGDTVRLKVTSIDVSHGIGIPAFGVNANLAPGQETVVEFVADRAGTFSFACTVFCGSGHSGMTGTLIVE